MLVSIGLIILGFILLIKGADFLVEGSSNIAKKFHIPEIIIGLTIVSIGTSMPELFVSTTSSINGYADMSIGNFRTVSVNKTNKISKRNKINRNANVFSCYNYIYDIL